MPFQTPKQRLLAVLHGEQVDRPPFICPGGMMNMVVTEVMHSVGRGWPGAHEDAEAMALLSAETHELACVENLGAPFCMTIEAQGLGAEVSLGTRETEPRVTAYAMDDLAELDRLRRFDPATGRAAVAAEAVRLMAEAHPDVPVIADLTGPVSLATSLVEPLTFYRAMRRDRARTHALLEVATDAAIAFGDALVGAGAEVVCLADPSATGELIGGKAFAEFALPYVNEIVRHFASRDVPSIVHICGDVNSLAASLPKVGAPAISVDSAVSIRALKEMAPGHKTMGNVSTYLLEYGKPETLAEVARGRVEAGVDIVAPACGIGARTPLANIRAVAEAVTGETAARAVAK